jgi:hypothetical protein
MWRRGMDSVLSIPRLSNSISSEGMNEVWRRTYPEFINISYVSLRMNSDIDRMTR